MLTLNVGLFVLVFTRLVACQYESEITWTISKTMSCEDQQQVGCRCETIELELKSCAKITCTCDHPAQVAHLKGSGDKPAFYDKEIIWTIENCSNITIHGRVLPHTEGVDFKLQFTNISAFEIKEDAFESIFRSTSSANQHKSVLFKRCKIENVPPRAFPANLERIEFEDCEIKTIKSNSFKQLYMNKMAFKDTIIDDIEPNAFYQDLVHWIARNSRFKRIQTNSITGGIQRMNWSMCTVDSLETNGIAAVIGHSQFEDSQFNRVETNGLTIHGWSSLSLINNVFHQVNNCAIDLTKRSDTAVLAVIKGNVWHNPSPNFIITGQVNSTIAAVQNNTFMEVCVCGNTFTPMITTESSKEWFVTEVLKNSRCPITDRASECLNRNDTFLFFDELYLLCKEYACTQDMESVSTIFTLKLPDHLFVITIGTLAGVIILSLLATICACFQRRQKSTTKQNQTSAMNKSFRDPRQDFADTMSHKMSQELPLHRPRSEIFEGVEMEDKGVQTMPNELSTDVLEGLREQLSRSDSFWDAKETIDHLYELIQVREQSTNKSPFSCPPDVTMCNNDIGASSSSSSSGTTHLNANKNTKNTNTSITLLTTPPPIPPHPGMNALRSSSVNIPQNNKTYAQVLHLPKTATLSEYTDPCDAQVHIYSELKIPSNQRPTNNSKVICDTPSSSAFCFPTPCDYNNPDVQTHLKYLDQNRQLFSPNANAGSTELMSPSTNIMSQTCQRPLPDVPLFSSSVQ